jgi:hypothetical protein
MSFLDKLRGMLGGSAGKPRGGAGGGSSFGGDDAQMHLVYAKCRRCGEPLLGRVNMMNEPSQEEDDTWVVRKTLSGSGKNYCFQTVEVTLQFDRQKKNVLSAEASGGALISAEEYAALVAAQAEAAEAEAVEDDAAASDDDTPQVKEA